MWLFLMHCLHGYLIQVYGKLLASANVKSQNSFLSKHTLIGSKTTVCSLCKHMMSSTREYMHNINNDYYLAPYRYISV